MVKCLIGNRNLSGKEAEMLQRFMSVLVTLSFLAIPSISIGGEFGPYTVYVVHNNQEKVIVINSENVELVGACLNEGLDKCAVMGAMSEEEAKKRTGWF